MFKVNLVWFVTLSNVCYVDKDKEMLFLTTFFTDKKKNELMMPNVKLSLTLVWYRYVHASVY